MVKNYFLVALRNLKGNLLHSFVNIIGLAIGMGTCILIWQFVSYQYSYDQFHKNKEDLYRLEGALYREGKLNMYTPRTPRLLGPTMKEIFPEVREYTRVYDFAQGIVTYKDVSVRVEHMWLADRSFLSMLSFPLLKGDPNTALAQPFSAVITESAAKKFFGDQDPMGKIIEVSRFGHWTYTITGVCKDVPHNSHLQFDFLFSIHSILDSPAFRSGWDHYLFSTYILVNPNTDAKFLEDKFKNVFEKRFEKELKAMGVNVFFSLTPLTDIYLYSPALVRNIKHFDVKIIYLLSIIAIFILTIGWINYINLCTAKGIDRAKEVSIRKVVGSSRLQLMKQFIIESVFFNMVAALLALVLVKIATPFFNQALGLPHSFSMLGEPNFWLVLLILLAVGSFLSGLYPAFILSSFTPVSVLSVQFKKRGRGMNLKKILVIFQLVISIVLITGTITTYNQVKFMKNKDLGVNIDQVLLIRTAPYVVGVRDVLSHAYTFWRELLRYPSIVSGTLGDVPGKRYESGTKVSREGSSTDYVVRCCWMDPGFVKTFQLKLLVGRDLSAEIASDRTDAVILNEVAVALLGFESPEKAVNQYILDNNQKLKIIGVMKNYHQKYLRDPIDPVIFRHYHHFGAPFFAFKLNTKNLSETIALIKDKWKQFYPGNPFEYMLMEDFYGRQYRTEMAFGGVFTALSLLAVFIACIGLYALYTYATLQRTKEIGIRKVFGADTIGIIALLLKDLFKLLFISILIAFPLAYYFFSKWLQFYAYRIPLGLWFFVTPLGIIIPIVLLATVYHVVKAAVQNPVKSLRYE